MEFAEYLAMLRRRWRLVVIGILICLAGAEIATTLKTRTYRTSTRLLVSATAPESAIDEITKRQLSSQRAAAYAQYATTGPAVAAAVKEADVTVPVSVSATATGTSPFLVIITTSQSAQAAADVANAYYRILPTVVTSLDQNPVGTALPKLSPLETAGVPSSPFSPKPRTNLLVGLSLGVILGFAAALLRETLDSTIRRSTDLERLIEVDLLGVVSKEYGDERLIAVTRPRSRRTEAYRQVRTNLEFTSAEGAPRSIVVTSAAPGEGKTTLAANLAVISSHAGKQVVLVDADLRRPTIADVFQVASSPGLTDVLSGKASLEAVLQPLDGERITILPSGTLPRYPSELLGSTAMLELIRELESRFDIVIIDSAPVMPVTDALVIGVNVGGVVLVTRLAVTTRSALRSTLRSLKNVNARVLGVVANGAVEEDDKRYGYGYGYLSDRKADKEDLVPVSHLKAAARRDDRDLDSYDDAFDIEAATEAGQSEASDSTPWLSSPAPLHEPIAPAPAVTSDAPTPTHAPIAVESTQARDHVSSEAVTSSTENVQVDTSLNADAPTVPPR